MAFRNVYAVLVHENQDCIIDLVHNLRCQDPASSVLLYDGGNDPRLLRHGFSFERYGAILCPEPQPMAWGRLHGFALQCMRFLLEHIAFDTITIVDSDQLATRADYSRALADFLSSRPSVGMVVNCPGPQDEQSAAGPAKAALTERDLWLPILRRFGDADAVFPRWSFWPSTVFTAAAVKDIVAAFESAPELMALLERTNIWATEEVIFPTLTAVLGHELVSGPFSFDYVRYRTAYSECDTTLALGRDDVYWMHPVPRRYHDPVRTLLRAQTERTEDSVTAARPPRPLPYTQAILEAAVRRMEAISGWLEVDEARLLADVCARAVAGTAHDAMVVEVGSYLGRSTSVLGSVVQALAPDRRVYAVDPHEGRTSSDAPESAQCTLHLFQENVARAGIADVVVPVARRSTDAGLSTPIALLFIDGLHDYANVARDFFAFESALVTGGLVVFHDDAPYYPGVQTFVRELLGTGRYQLVGRARSLTVLVRETIAESATIRRTPAVDRCPRASALRPLVSCIMPTADRPLLVRESVYHFLRQSYEPRELVIVDSGRIPVHGILPSDERIRYIRAHRRLNIGEARNLACSEARGEVIAHWDDDDWCAPWRLDYQVTELLRTPAVLLCGAASVLFFDPVRQQCWQYTYPNAEQPWVCGGTLCYYRSLWQRSRFRNVQVGEDSHFVWNADAGTVLPLSRCDFYVATIHEGNTSPRYTTGPRWQPREASLMRTVLQDDYLRYQRWGDGVYATGSLWPNRTA
jgi:hypothetical protein